MPENFVGNRSFARESKKLNRARLPVRIFVYDIDDNEIRNLMCDYNVPAKRKWFSQLVTWATQNGHTVEIMQDGESR